MKSKGIFVLFSLAFFGPATARASEFSSQSRGYLFSRLTSYTEKSNKNYGQEGRVQLEQATSFGSNAEAINQLRWTSNTLNSDLSSSTLAKKETFDTYLGENFLKYKSDNWVAQIGYQEVVWGEAFGFNYADIINPKDQRETLYSDAADARLPLLLFNGKTFFTIGDETSGSLQFLYSPEPRFSKTLPIEVYAGSLFKAMTINVEKEKSPSIFKESEMGGKFSLTFKGYDFSFFHFSYIDRDPHYALSSANLLSLNLKEEHNKISSSGLSLAKTVYDFVARIDLVMTKDKMVNYLDGALLKANPTDSFNALVSLDSPTYRNYSGVLIFASSNLKEVRPNSFRERQEQYMIGKITRDLGGDKSWELSYTHEFEHAGHSIQTFVNWPVTSSTDLKLGGQFYFGEDQSNLKKYKDISSLFFSLKNYFQL